MEKVPRRVTHAQGVCLGRSGLITDHLKCQRTTRLHNNYNTLYIIIIHVCLLLHVTGDNIAEADIHAGTCTTTMFKCIKTQNEVK